MRDLRLARSLGEYVDRLSGGTLEDALELFRAHPELAGELEVLQQFQSLLEDRLPATRFGDFRIIRQIGRGGMGVVFEAEQISLHRRVALKVLPGPLMPDSRAMARFQREARLGASLTHPNIVQVYSMGIESGTPYFAMEYVEGTTLREAGRLFESKTSGPERLPQRAAFDWTTLSGFSRSGRLRETGDVRDDEVPRSRPSSFRDFKRVAELFAGAADGLQHAHGRGIVHRDLKPSNLIVDSKDRLRILDFGLACVEGQETLTKTRDRLGTPLYMSPEQAAGPPCPLDHRTDIYGLGVTCYEVLSGRPPFLGRDDGDTLQQILVRDPAPIRKLNPTVPRDLETIVMKCLRKDPPGRYGTAEAFAQDLRRFSRGDPIEARPQPWHERLRRRAWRERRRLAEVVGVLALVLMVAVLAYWRIDHAADSRERLWEAGLRSSTGKLLSEPLVAATSGIRVPDDKAELIPLPEGQTELSSKRDGGVHRLLEGGSSAVAAGPVLADVRTDPLTQAVNALRGATEKFGDRALSHYHLARGLALQGNIAEAKQSAALAIELDGNLMPARALLAALLEIDGDENRTVTAPPPDPDAADLRRAWLAVQRAYVAKRWNEWAAAWESLVEKLDAGELSGSLIESRLARGIARLTAGNTEGALVDIAAGIQDPVESTEAALLLGKILHLKDRRREAQELFLEAHRKAEAPFASKIVQRIANAYMDLHEFRLALEWLRRLDESDESTAKLCMKAECLRNLGRLDEAEETAAAAIAGDRQSAEARLVQGNVLMTRGAFADAYTVYNQAALLDRDSPFPLLAQAVCLEAYHDLEGAERLLRLALDLDVRCAEVHYELGRVLSQGGRLDDAKRHYERVIELDPRHALAHNNVGTLLDRRGDIDGAIRYYRKAVEFAPGIGLIHHNLAWAYHRQRRFGRAAREYRKALALGLDEDLEALVQNNLGPCLQHMGRLDEAVAAYLRAIELNPGNAVAHHSVGTAFERKGELEEAIEHFGKAVELAPTWVDAQNDLGHALQTAGRISEAIPRYERVFELDPGSVWARNNMARLLIEERRPYPEGDALKRSIRGLENVANVANVAPEIEYLLDEYRAALLPDIASMASVDALIEDASRELVSKRSTWRYRTGAAPPPPGVQWTSPDFDDSSWSTGPAPLGRPARDGVTTLLPETEGKWSTLYLRQRFFVPESVQIGEAELAVEIRGGFVAYLNGEEVGRRNAGRYERIPHDAVADHPENEPWRAKTVTVAAAKLRHRENVLAIHGLRYSADEDEFSFAAAFRLGSEAPRETPRTLDLLKQFRSTLRGDAALATLEYFQGRVQQMRGNLREAETRFRGALAIESSSPRPHLRIVECLRAREDPVAAERFLRETLLSGDCRDDRVWDAWLHLCLADLGKQADEVVSMFPLPGGDEALEGRPSDLFWGMDRLREDGALRINCGGAACEAADGRRWSRDRFWQGGFTYYCGRLDELGIQVRDEAIFQTQRLFREVRNPAYRIPLPRGRYRVVLHFVEGYYLGDGWRRFDVLVESRKVLSRFEPLQAGGGFLGVPSKREVEVEVDDGELTIEFVMRAWKDPIVSALEVERLR